MIGAFLGYKGNQAAAKAAQGVAEFNAKTAENEAKVSQTKKTAEDANLRKTAERTIATQRVATVASGIEMSGSALEALKDSYMNTQMDALNLAYASDIEQTAKASEAALARAEGRAKATAYKTASYQSLLEGAEKAASYGMS
mgnify:FL=1|tara:strand:- start:9093 stop:9518 length:426 start_codon:yes stop_codon:yes gene_type:complete